MVIHIVPALILAIPFALTHKTRDRNKTVTLPHLFSLNKSLLDLHKTEWVFQKKSNLLNSLSRGNWGFRYHQ
jgi:hypothetical protein